MNTFLANVDRIRLTEREESMSSTPGAQLPGAVPRRGERGNQAPELRRASIAAKQRQYTSTYREAREAAKAGDTGRVQVLLRALPPTYQRELVSWCARNGVRWTS